MVLRLGGSRAPVGVPQETSHVRIRFFRYRLLPRLLRPPCAKRERERYLDQPLPTVVEGSNFKRQSIAKPE